LALSTITPPFTQPLVVWNSAVHSPSTAMVYASSALIRFQRLAIWCLGGFRAIETPMGPLMKPTIYPSLREAIYYTVARSKLSTAALAAELGWTPSQLSRHTSLDGASALPFPCDERLVKLMQITGDHSILYTMADLLGYDVVPKAERLPEMLADLIASQHEQLEKAQALLKRLEAQGQE
jgi:hypothetical protein